MRKNLNAMRYKSLLRKKITAKLILQHMDLTQIKGTSCPEMKVAQFLGAQVAGPIYHAPLKHRSRESNTGMF